MATPVPVVVVAGFLGAGKTSLVNHLVSQCHDLRAAVVVNDFGAINIDAELVVGVDGNVYGLANGCICCAIRDDLVSTCLGLIRTFGALDLVIVETSGASDPLQVANAFMRPELAGMMQVSAILGVVDAVHFGRHEGDIAQLARTQLSVADIVVLNKADLVSVGGLAEMKAVISETATRARILETSHGIVPLNLVLDLTRLPALGGRARFLADGGGNAHTYLATWVWEQSQPLALNKLREAFDALPAGLYRAKGFIHLDEMPDRKILLQMVGRRSSLNAGGPWNGQGPATRVVMIGAPDAMSPNALRDTLDASVADPGSPSALRLLVSQLSVQTHGAPDAL
ncbi:GTP-binding protein [Aquabacter sp. CN5-332]|uniref:CobW family GTP-binding protein n=1 Tax=Aquabacter sp. CN5-332 TaxID=3156608 RepID=UPI0032B31EB2